MILGLPIVPVAQHAISVDPLKGRFLDVATGWIKKDGLRTKEAVIYEAARCSKELMLAIRTAMTTALLVFN